MVSKKCMKQYLLLLLLWASYASSYLLRKPLGVVKSQIQAEFKVSSEMLGMMDVAMFLPYAGVSLGFGWLADKIGPRITFGVGLLLSGVCAGAVGWCSSIWAICVFLFGIGMFQALCWPAACSILTSLFPVNELNSIFGVFGTSCFAGGIIATYFSVILQEKYGWRGVFLPCGVIPIIFGCLIVIFARVPKKYVANDGVYHSTTSSIDGVEGGDVEEGSPKKLLSCFQVIRLNMVLQISISILCMKFVRYAVLSWLPMFLEKGFKYSPSAAGIGSTSYEIGGFIGSLFIGILVTYCFCNNNLIANFLLCLLTGVALLAFTVSIDAGTVTHMACLGLAGMFNSASDILLTGSIAMTIGEKHGAKAAVGGVINGIGSIGSVIQGPVIGWVSGSMGWLSIMPVLIMSTTIAGIAGIRAYQLKYRIK